MGIYIPGMEMPKDCPMCPMAHWNKLDEFTGCEIKKRFFSKEELNTDYRPAFCTLIPVPPHGDLVERQAVLNTFSVHMNRTLHFVTIRDTIPIIIPAEEGAL